LTKNPSAAVAMATETALTGQWTAPDGKTIKIDGQSLAPGVEESVFPPAASGDCSFATQVFNLVMANDALQRRVPPEYYVQRTPDNAIPGDTGERRLDPSGGVISATQFDNNTRTWNFGPDDSPGLTNHEISQISTRINGRDCHLIEVADWHNKVDDEVEGGVETVNSKEELQQKLHQLKQQGEFPITIAVDGNHGPIQEEQKESPSTGGHVVTIDGYDEATGTVHISNQWGKQSDKWMKLDDLYKNADGEIASSKDGIDSDDR
jgi:hypothetical protein